MAGDGAARRALYEDPYTDARMRRLVPRFAVLCMAAYTVVGVAVTRDARDALTFGLMMLVTLVLTAVVARRDLLARVSRRVVFVVLLCYGAAIAAPASPHPAIRLLDEILLVIAVLFGSVFFGGWARYAAPLSLAVTAHVVQTVVAGGGSWGQLAARAAGFVLVGAFGGEVADTLRESLRAQQAVHSVLAVARRDLPDDEIAAAGLCAALSVSGWDAGSVALVDGEFLRAAAIQGLPGEVVSWHGEQPRLRVDGPGLSAAVVRSGEPQYIANENELLGAEQAVITWGASCLAGVPIRYRGEVLGSLNLVDRRRRSFATGERERLERVAEQLGLALGSARAYRREAAVAAGLLDLNRRKDEFLANVSHELRTPATSLGLAARTLHAGRGRLTEEQEERIIEMMRRRSAELTGLIEGLLAEAIAANGQTRLEIQPVDWADALPRWADAASDVTMRPVTVEAPDEPLVTFSDPAKCERIVMNLLSNAAKFSEPDTPIVCRVTGVGDCVELSVTDHGIGIPESVLPRVFDRFFQADGSMTRAHGGLGIGLSLVRHFAEAHGGTVEVASTEGVGTTVMVTLPRNIRPLRAVVPA
jgi:signal transduction histidine kinase